MSLMAGARHGRLELQFVQRDGQTVLLRDHQKAPLQIVRPFQLETGELMAFIINPTAGVMGGDRHEIRVHLGAGTRVLLTTQTANKIHRMHPGEYATAHFEAWLENGAHLEYHPERTIPFADSSFEQVTRLHLAGQASLCLSESYAAGRVAGGERLGFRRLATRTELRVNARLEYLDASDLEPHSADLGGLGALEGRSYWAAGIAAGGQSVASGQSAVTHNHPSAMATHTAHGHSLTRITSDTGLETDRALQSWRDAVRLERFGMRPLRWRR